MLKLESKNSLLARVWLSIEFIIFQSCIARSRLFMVILTDKSYWALVTQALSWCCFACVLSLSPFQREPFLRSVSLVQGVIPDSSSVPVSAKYFYSLSSTQNSVIELKTQIIIKFNFQSISYV
jgi:hypothetical protein